MKFKVGQKVRINHKLLNQEPQLEAQFNTAHFEEYHTGRRIYLSALPIDSIFIVISVSDMSSRVRLSHPDYADWMHYSNVKFESLIPVLTLTITHRKLNPKEDQCLTHLNVP